MPTITLPDIGGDINTWGQELNDALTAINAAVDAFSTTFYSKTQADARYIRTVNSTGPDGSGNVVVSGGGGGGAVSSVNGQTGAVVITPASIGALTSSSSLDATKITGNLPSSQVSGTFAVSKITGLAAVATSGLATDLNLTGFSVPVNYSVEQNSTTRAWPARPATSKTLFFMTLPDCLDSELPTSDGSISGGGGMVIGLDILVRKVS